MELYPDERGPMEVVCPFCHLRTQLRRHYLLGRGMDTEFAGTLILDFLAPRTGRHVNCCIYTTQFIVFCYSSLNGLGHPTLKWK
jgi:hypothetical protein